MPSFVIIGEGPAALSVAKHIITRDGSIAAIFTNETNSRSVLDLASESGISVCESAELKQPDLDRKFSFSDCTWLLNVFSPLIVPTTVLEKFGEKALNVHNGPLPEYAGLHVTQWALRNGETRFAATVHIMAKEIDGGKIIATRAFPVKSTDTGLSLFMTSVRESANAMNGVVDQILAGESLVGMPQDASRRRVYRHKDALDPSIDWNLPANDICNFVRAGNYRPLTSPTYTATLTTKYANAVLVTRAEPEYGAGGKPKTVLELRNRGPLIACGEGAVRLTQAHIGDKEILAVAWSRILDGGIR